MYEKYRHYILLRNIGTCYLKPTLRGKRGTVLPDVVFLHQIGYLLGIVAGFCLFVTWPLGGNGVIYDIKTLTRSATVE